MVEEQIVDELSESPLETKRLILRPLVEADAARQASLINDRGIAAMLARVPNPYTVADARAFIADHGREIVFAICLKSDGNQLIGCCGLEPATARDRASIGYWIGRDYWGQGLATEAAQAMIDHGFSALKLSAIDVSCRVVNEASRRVIRKCGFQFCGSGVISTLSAGRVASEHFTMDRRCWESLKAWGRG